MKPAPFDMVRPAALDEALAALAAVDDAKLIAGGQSLVPSMNFRLAAPSLVVDLNAVSGLDGIRRDDDRLRIGAMTRQATLLTDERIAQYAPLIPRAVAHVGHVQTRSRGTIGGSLAHADPSAELPLVMVVLGAEMTIARSGSERVVAAADFFVDALTTIIEADEILIEIAIPVIRPDGRSSFREYARRHGDFALAAVAAQTSGSTLSLGVGGLASIPRRCLAIERAYAAGAIGAEDLWSLIEADLGTLEPLDDLHASGAYRRRLAGVLIADVLGDLARAA